MHLRRVLLLIAMVLLLTAGVVAITSPRPERGTGAGVVVPPAPLPARTATPRSVSLTFPPPRSLPVVRLVQGDHALVEVRATQPGEAAVMGLSDTAEPGTPATFDLLAELPKGYYEALL